MEPNMNDTLLSKLEYIQDELKIINKKLSQASLNNTARSAELEQLFQALAAAQSEMPSVAARGTNPYYKQKYVLFQDMINASRPALTKQKLAVIQQILPNTDGQMILHTVLTHESGQWIESRLRVIPPKADLTTLNSYLTALKRYAYSAMVGIVGSDDDDDGEYASATSRETFAKGTALNTKYNPKENSYETITKEQLEELEYELEEYPDIAEDVLDGLKIQNLADMPKEKFIHAINKVREIKLLRNGR